MAGDSGTRSIGRHCPRSARDQELRHRGSRSDHHDVAGTSPFSCGPAFHGRADRALPIDDGDAAVELVATGTGPNDMSDKRSSATRLRLSSCGLISVSVFVGSGVGLSVTRAVRRAALFSLSPPPGGPGEDD